MTHYGLFYRYGALQYIDDESFEGVKKMLRYIEDDGKGFAYCIVSEEGMIYALDHSGIEYDGTICVDKRSDKLVQSVRDLGLPVDLTRPKFAPISLDN